MGLEEEEEEDEEEKKKKKKKKKKTVKAQSTMQAISGRNPKQN